ncbi:MAG: patatin-like phospholipase family protein [Xanthobacteraceae bacterium]
MTNVISLPRSASSDKKIGLVLQGGGALGSYQAGVFQALTGAQYVPDWVAGISIGAINAAIIAGNAPGQRAQQLRNFWEKITATTTLWPCTVDGGMAAWQHRASALSTVMFGLPGFFMPRPASQWFSSDQCVSFYDTSALRLTLERLIDFDRINQAKEMRFSVGAVNVRTGQSCYFDSAEITIRPEHVMASAALPPGFPPVEIEGEQYWDGGLFSNTPLQYMVDYYPRRSRLIFQVDLFPAHGYLPINFDQVSEREKDLRYSSRTRVSTDALRERHDVRHAINELHKLLPPEIASTEQAQRLYAHGCVTQMDIVQLIYRPHQPLGGLKDFEFSRATMSERWLQGEADASTTLAASPWLAPMPSDLGVRVFDVLHDLLMDGLSPQRAPDGADPLVNLTGTDSAQ